MGGGGLREEPCCFCERKERGKDAQEEKKRKGARRGDLSQRKTSSHSVNGRDLYEKEVTSNPQDCCLEEKRKKEK